MIVISRHVAIPDGELEITAIRAQGAGGQHVNKTSTAIHLLQCTAIRQRSINGKHHFTFITIEQQFLFYLYVSLIDLLIRLKLHL